MATTQMPGRVKQHYHLLGILWLALSAISAIGGVIAIVVANTFIAHMHDMGAPREFPSGFMSTLATIIGVLVLAKAAVGFLAGWGLMHREPWARVVALVLSFVALLNIPFGTAIGVYTMWVLLPGQSQEEYDELVAANAAA
jgi:hypothetical protein